MKVILSVNPIRFPLTGIGRYVYELASQLKKSTDISELLFCAGFFLVSELPKAKENSGIQHIIKRLVQKSYLLREVYYFTMRYRNSVLLRNYEDYVFHGTHFSVPNFSGKRVATIHDLSAFTCTTCDISQRVRYNQKEILNSIKHADALITVSHFTRVEIANYFSYPLNKIHAVPLASADCFFLRCAEEVLPKLIKYRIKPGEYTLFVGTIEPRKNILTLLQAYSRLPRTILRCWPLVIVGYQGWLNKDIFKCIRKAENEGWVKYLGFVSNQDLPILVSGAKLFAFPSLYEGFGLPVLEAMVSGIPVVCSNSSSLPEITGKAALMCDPLDIETLTQFLHQGLEDENWRRQAIANGLEQSAKFSWARCSQQTMDVYRSLI